MEIKGEAKKRIMSETKQIRIPQAATRFGVGASHIVDFLKEKGFSVTPATKLSDEMFDLLAKEYQQDAALKDKASHIEIGGARGKEELTIDKVVTTSKPKEEEEELRIKTSTITTEVKFEQKEKKKKPEPEEVVKVESTTTIKGPKVVGKMEVVEEAEPKKKTKAGKATKKKKEETEEQPVEETASKIIEEIIQPQPQKPEEGEFIKRKKVTLDGPKLMGKIEIKEPEVKPKPEKPKEERQQRPEGERRPRKRIPISKVDVADDRNRRGGDRSQQRPAQKSKQEAPQEISEKEIQDKIRETQAKLAGLMKGKGSKKYKRQKRDAHAATTEAAGEKSNVLEVTEFISVSELASMMDVGYTQVISKCMELGVMVSINQRLDAEIIELVANEFGFVVKFVSVEDKDDDIEEIEDDPEDLKDRPPVVTVMGHVDHGKTTLLDFIRKAKVAEGEAGGITQHIGAYEVTSETGKKVVFLDTPGHEAFTAMRARGAKITDVAVIVIAADDSVMPQTKEAISHAQAAGVPMVFAINKIDKDGANSDRIREQLSQMNILVEEWGGKFQCQEISAKKGLNIDKLLEKILLEAELLELKANPDRPASGTVIEATLDKGRGYVATVLVQNGTLNLGDVVIAGTNMGKVKALFSSFNEKIEATGPASACTILGLDGAPQAGEKFHVMDDESEAKEIVNKRKQILREQGIRTKKHITLDEIGRRLALGNFKELNIIIKGDVDGSVEALTDSLLKLSTDEVQVKVVLRGVGQITESDVLLASASDAIIIGFNVRASANAKKLADKENIEIKYYSIIYNVIEEIKTAMEGLLEPTIEERITGNVEVREVFKITKVGTVAGCFVTDGKIYRTSKVRIIRDGIVIHTAQLGSLKRYKDEVKEVVSGQECGIHIKDYNDLLAGDIIECFEQTEVKRKL
jgi:translation initiation factor IF-2